MRKLIYTVVLAVGSQFVTAQKIDAVFYVNRDYGICMDFNGLEFDSIPASMQNVGFWAIVRFSNTTGEILHPEEDGSGDIIRAEVYVNNAQRFPVLPGTATNDPDKGYFIPTVVELSEIEEVPGFYFLEDAYLADIYPEEHGFLGYLGFDVAKIALNKGTKANKLCVKLTHWQRGGEEPTLLDEEEFCVNFYINAEGGGGNPPDTTSVAESALMAVKVHPNPVRDAIKIDNLNVLTDISVYSITGQLLASVPSAMGKVEIDVNNFANGVYFVKMQSGENVQVKKIQVVK
ncbi:MAG: T9SS type A sorting domain-containing protein [Lentimicrobiaceae bacterium]|nr:T9SS type A sorting domain-containing protein [Lentimicrobiaceae bacterium]MCL2132372.1 T9SS type A sorting domain-containing protein [Lentimicrobiaceae bacterium]